MSRNAEYLARMETQLRKWDADVDALAVAHKKAGLVARAAHYERLKALRDTRTVAHEALRQMRAADPVDPRLYAHIQAAWESMQAAYEKASRPPRD